MGVPIVPRETAPWEWPPPFKAEGAVQGRRPLAQRLATGFDAVGDGAAPALSHLFSKLCSANALEEGRSQAVWRWLHGHAKAWRGGAPVVHAVDVSTVPTMEGVHTVAEQLGLHGDAITAAISNEVAAGVCLAETEAVATEALRLPHAHPQTWLKQVDATAVTDAQVQAVARGAVRTALGVQGAVSPQEALDQLLLPAAQHPEGRALLETFLKWLEDRATDSVQAETVMPTLSGQGVGDTIEVFNDALEALGPSLLEVILQLPDGRRHAMLVSTQSLVNGAWFYDPNHLGFFCAQDTSTRTFMRDFADYVERMYSDHTIWHWLARIAA